MKSLITRWKTVPSYSGWDLVLRSRGSRHSRLPVASSVKLATVFGACSGMSRTVNVPFDVVNLAVVGMKNLLSILREGRTDCASARVLRPADELVAARAVD